MRLVVANVPTDADRVHVLAKMPRQSVCAEIGVFEGEFSQVILHVVEPAKLHLIDPWVFRPDRSQTIYGGRAPRVQSQRDMDARYEMVRDKYAAAPSTIHRGSSVDVAAQFEDGYFDWIYIDGDHYYSGVLADLKRYAPKVKRGGFIVGDDFNWNSDPDVDYPVRAALEAFLKQGRVSSGQIITWNGETRAIECVDVVLGEPLPRAPFGRTAGQYVLVKG